jgi:EAL domain-containing protein (putative c-di-GMP-specific phosphodiesterase class I)
MSGRHVAVIVGVNRCPDEQAIPALRYAERDAVEMAAVLTDGVIGTFAFEAVDLLVGPAATAAPVKTALRVAARSADQDDFLLVYFAGHGVSTPSMGGGGPFLGTADLNLSRLETNPDSGLRMGFLRQDVFDDCAAPSLLILDCCHAGGYLERGRHGEVRTLQQALNRIYEQPLARHSALLSCPASGRARETSALRHGVFTHHLLAGLRGQAANDDGCVSLEDLGGFISRLDLTPPPGRFIQTWGRGTVLTQPGRKRHDSLDAPERQVLVQPLHNPMRGLAPPLLTLLDRLFHDEAARPAGQPDRLGRLAAVLDADAAALVDFSPTDARVVAASASFSSSATADLLRQLAPRLAAARRGALGHATDDGSYRSLAVPVLYGTDRSIRALVAINLHPSFLGMGEPLGAALAATWRLDPAEDGREAELAVLTALRSKFGRVPINLYQHSFRLYGELLDSVVMAFEPIMEISPLAENVGIYGWEALARSDAGARSAPAALLRAAEVWGDEFIIERDSALAAKAIRSYAYAHAAGSSGEAPRPLSINVAVPALLSDAYVRVLREVIAEAGLGGRKVTLEISERDPIAPRPDEDWGVAPMEYFRQRLAALAHDEQLTFAVDDFGVGYASLDRISSLPLAQIKIDRAVLGHPLVLKELALVVEVAGEAVRRGAAPTPRTVVVEGYDDTVKVPLSAIFRAGIHFVQGYIAGRGASPELQGLDDQARRRIASLVAG